VDDPRAGYRKGSLKFVLHGRRLRGGWALVRMRPREPEPRGKENWLLIKERDEDRGAGERAAPARPRKRAR
jgi:bifunctional non-homologous end joining protein LigD